jgi:murein tripeptide amidase MpaA
MSRGALAFLTSKDFNAQKLRRKFIFKVVPMINPDGHSYTHTFVLLGLKPHTNGNHMHTLYPAKSISAHLTLISFAALKA